MNNEKPTPETDAAIADGYTFNHEDLRPVIALCQRLECQRNEAREANTTIQAREAELVLSKERISKRAEAIRCELVEKEKQLEAMRAKMIATEAYQAGLAADNEAMREAIGVVGADLESMATMPEYDQDDAHRLRHQAQTALTKLQPFIKP